jgi:hypothetical protein
MYLPVESISISRIILYSSRLLFQGEYFVPFHFTIIDTTALFEPYPFLEDSVRLHPVSILLDFFKNIVSFLKSEIVSFTSNLQHGGPGPRIYVPQ